MLLLISISISPASASIVFSDNFNDNDVSDWTKNAIGNADVIANDGRMRLNVYKCSDIEVSKDIGFVSGDITVDFDWESHAEGWWEGIAWKLFVDDVEVVYEGIPIRQYGGYSGHKTKTLNVNGDVRLVFLEARSSYCNYGDHHNTYLWVDNIEVSVLPPTAVVFSDDFNDNDVSDWTKNAIGNADVIANDGRMRLNVYKCSDIEVSKDIGFVSGDITVDFDWESHAEGWWEGIAWKLFVDDVEVVYEGIPIRQYGGYSGHKTKTLNVNGDVRLVFLEARSSYCRNGDHHNTYLWVDNLVVKSLEPADEIPPEITINSPTDDGVYFLYQSLAADWSATDAFSGLKSTTGTVPTGETIDTSSVGVKTFSVTATDNADNSITKTVFYTIAYDFLGILPPVKIDGSSAFKSGRTIPVKFRIADADGNVVSDASATLTFQSINDGGTLDDGVEAISTSSASEGNAFRYDTEDDLYIFNMNTKGMDAGTYQLNINLDDGTVKTVEVSLE